MKFLSAALFLSSLVATDAFSAVAPKSTTPNLETVDKSMPNKDSPFDPTSGDSSALKRNNNDEVWVPQVY